MGDMLKEEEKVANMPRIRVVPKKIKKKKINHLDTFASRFNIDAKKSSSNALMAGKPLADFVPGSPRNDAGLMSLQVKKTDRKSRIDHEQMMAKITKIMNGDEKVKKAP